MSKSSRHRHTEVSVMCAEARIISCHVHPHSLLAVDPLQGVSRGTTVPSNISLALTVPPRLFPKNERAPQVALTDSHILLPCSISSYLPPLSTWPPHSLGEGPPSWNPPASLSSTSTYLGLVSLRLLSPEHSCFTLLSFLAPLVKSQADWQ